MLYTTRSSGLSPGRITSSTRMAPMAMVSTTSRHDPPIHGTCGHCGRLARIMAAANTPRLMRRTSTSLLSSIRMYSRRHMIATTTSAGSSAHHPIHTTRLTMLNPTTLVRTRVLRVSIGPFGARVARGL